MVHFFVSYNKADRSWAEWIAWQLEELGHTTVLQAWDFRPGTNWPHQMRQAIAAAERTIAVLSPDYLMSEYAAPEWYAAFAEDPTGEKRILLPVRVREGGDDRLLRQFVYINLVGLDEEASRQALRAGVAQGRAKPQTTPQFPGMVAPSVPERPRYPGSPPPIWNVPYTRNIRFVGRESELNALAESLEKGEHTSLVQAIHGLGGVGKTQLASEYAHRHVADYDVVWWIRAEDPATLEADFLSLAVALGLPEGARTADRVVDSVRRHLAQTDGLRWLLVLDNAPDLEAVHRYLPDGGGRVLITSQNPIWRRAAETLLIDVLPRDDAVRFLVERTGRHDEAETARQLAEEMGDLPLALEQAGAYIDARNLSMSGYLERYRTHRTDLLRRGKPDDYRATVATTWELSFAEVTEQTPAAAGLMNLIGFLASDMIPLDLLVPHAGQLPDPLAGAMADPIVLDDVVAALRRYSLVEADESVISVHRLVQGVTRDRLPDNERVFWVSEAIKILIAAAPDSASDSRRWPTWARLLPHVLVAMRNGDDVAGLKPQIAILQVRAGLYLWSRARSEEARPLLESALLTAEAEHGADHPEVAVVLHHLALVLFSLGDMGGAKRRLARALEIDKLTFGKDDLEIANDLSLMGRILRQEGMLPEAQEQIERALAIRRAVHKGDHRDVAISLNDLGNLRRQRGDFDAARAYHEEALRIHEAEEEPDLREVATVLDNLGQDLLRSGKLLAARARLDRALAIREEVFGSEHPTTAISIGNIGRVLHAVEKLPEAKEWLQRTLEIDERASGDHHPDVATDLNSLAGVQLQQDDLIGARDSLLRALAIRQQYPANYNEGAVFYLLGFVAWKMGRLEEGLRLLAAQFIVNRLIHHPDAEEKNLPALRSAATSNGYSEKWLEKTAAEVEAVYLADRGRGLVEAAFPKAELTSPVGDAS